jgi:hypothetical protein
MSVSGSSIYVRYAAAASTDITRVDIDIANASFRAAFKLAA